MHRNDCFPGVLVYVELGRQPLSESHVFGTLCLFYALLQDLLGEPLVLLNAKKDKTIKIGVDQFLCMRRQFFSVVYRGSLNV